MILKNVKLRNFRCHDEYFLECRDLTTLILGENGCGKTSVLEAIYVALAGKSFRAVDREILRRGADFYRVELMRTDGEKYVVSYDGEGKTYSLADKKFKRLPAKYKYPIILFEPVDLNLVAASPGRRRDYFDRLIGQLDAKYANSLSRYNKALKQRNELLKKDFVRRDEVFSWDVMLARLGVEVMEGRRDIVQKVDAALTEKYRGIADNLDVVGLTYESEVRDESEYLAKLMGIFERDRMLGHTSYGVHKDNFDFIFNGSLAEGSASRGELRSMVLALKFIEADLVEQMLGKKALILLDDVFSELDDTRQKCLKTNFKDNQIIITSVQ